MIKASEKNTSLLEALRRPRYEVIPLPGVEEGVLEHAPKEAVLAVTASPKKGLGPTLELAGRLSARGFRVAPHLSARLVTDEEHLEDILHRMREHDIREAFVVAGDAAEPAGKFAGAYDLLAAMAEVGHGLEEVGITGYPESHPLISDAATVRAMHDKAPHASYVVSQICFSPRTIEGWVRRVRERGVGLPIYVGMPGVVNRQKLVRISAGLGLGESARFLRKQRSTLLRLLRPGGYKPDRLIRGLSKRLEDSRYGVRGFHVYTFNDLRETEQWRREMLDRLGEKESST